jgi:hypothetical protein
MIDRKQIPAACPAGIALPDDRHPINPPSLVQTPNEAKSLSVTKIISASNAARPVLNAHSCASARNGFRLIPSIS